MESNQPKPFLSTLLEFATVWTMLLEGFSHIVMLERCSIKKIEGLYVLGKPDMTVIAFGSREVDIYKVNDVMTTQGWSLNALHKPSR